MPHLPAPPPADPQGPPFLLATDSVSVVLPSPVSAEAYVSSLNRQICHIVRQCTLEMYCLIAQETPQGRNGRHAAKHIRQIAIYVCHVGLSLSITQVALCFGRDQATIRSCCLIVEERRENPGFDEFVTAIERLSKSIYGIMKEAGDDLQN
ncbi:hypothetical protein [Agrobacterium larrymoorei]|uniref:hypothetical protein n=1 Tax=Agrobacterium larrymoorei TaxID=160699 RepID=UPI001F45EFB5|nr:hypothetical protein [Agrobacterium larrymoorei]